MPDIKNLIGVSTKISANSPKVERIPKFTYMIYDNIELFDRLNTYQYKALFLFLFWKLGGENREVVKRIFKEGLKIQNWLKIKNYYEKLQKDLDLQEVLNAFNDFNEKEQKKDVLFLIRLFVQLYNIDYKQITTLFLLPKELIYVKGLTN